MSGIGFIFIFKPILKLFVSQFEPRIVICMSVICHNPFAMRHLVLEIGKDRSSKLRFQKYSRFGFLYELSNYVGLCFLSDGENCMILE